MQNKFVYGELGRTPMKNTFYINVIKYWCKILQMEPIKYAKILCNTLLEYEENNNDTKSWAYNVKILLQSIGFSHVWIYQGVGDIDMFLLAFKERIRDVFLQNWINELNESTRSSSYTVANDAGPDYVKVRVYKSLGGTLQFTRHVSTFISST